MSLLEGPPVQDVGGVGVADGDVLHSSPQKIQSRGVVEGACKTMVKKDRVRGKS